MILFENVSAEYKRASFDHPRQIVLRNVNLAITRSDKIAILGAAGAGKTTLLRLMCGLLKPSGGKIERTMTVSFPVGFAAASGRMTLSQYIHFVSTCYGVAARDLRDFVIQMTDLDEDLLERRVSLVHPEIRVRVNMAIAYGISFDLYIFDQRIIPPDQRYRKRFEDIFSKRVAQSGVILATRDPRTARRYCKSGVVVKDKSTVFFAELEDAIGFFEKTSARQNNPSDSVYFEP